MNLSKFLYIICLILWSCASVQAPQGGPKDDIPPRLLNSNPRNGETGFAEKFIALDFSENVLENNSKQLFFSPQVTTTTKQGNRRLRIIPDSGFKPNTTYNLRLGGKIKDEREGIALGDTSILFSTGSRLDTLSLTTDHVDWGNKPADGKRLVQLIDTNETVYFSEGEAGKPISVAGLHDGWYRLMAFRDGNENYLYEDSDGPLFFEQIRVDSNFRLTIKALPHQSKRIQLFKQRRGDTLSLEGSGPFSLRGDLLKKVIYQSPQGNKYKLFPVKHTTRVEVIDSVGNCQEYTLDLLKIDSTRSLELAENGLIIRKKPLKKGITLELEYDWRINICPQKSEFTFDSVWTTLELECRDKRIAFNLESPKAGKLKLRYDSLGFFNKKGIRVDSIEVTTEDLTAHGEISGRIETETKREVVVEILTDRGLLVDKSKGKVFDFTVRPGKYRLQCFEDLNGDGRYTGGNMKEKRQGEPLYRFGEMIELKPGWDIENLKLTPRF